jgi:hypothetical protein
MFWAPVMNIKWLWLHTFVYGTSFLFHWSSHLFCDSTMLFYCYSAVVYFEVRYCKIPSIGLFVQYCFAYSRYFCIYMNFRIYFSLIMNNEIGIEIQDGNRDRASDFLSSWPRDSAKKLETCLAEVKHKGEPKTWHSKHLDSGRLLHATL